MKEKDIKQRMIFMCDLPIGDGSEFSGVHPCLVASVDIRNGYSPNLYVFPITHSDKKWQPTHYKLYKDKYPFFSYDENIVTCEEGKSISRSRFQRKVGEIDESDFANILKCKDYVFYERKNGIPFSKIDRGQSFEYENEIYMKLLVRGTNKYGAMCLKTCEYVDFNNDDLVIQSWNLQKVLENKSNSVREEINKKKY